MREDELVKDQGIFHRFPILYRSDLVDDEDLHNLFVNLKQYRDYADPSSQDWRDYTLSIFHLFGFETITREKRLFTIGEIGSNKNSLATVVVVDPYEDMFQAVNGPRWGPHLFYAGKYYQTRWGIITNGLTLKIFDLDGKKFDAEHLTLELEEMLRDGSLEVFSKFYFAMLSIKGGIRSVQKRSNTNRPNSEFKELRGQLYKNILEKFKEARPGVTNAKASYGDWSYLPFGSGKSYVNFGWSINKSKFSIYLWLGHPDQNVNVRNFDDIISQKNDIESEVGSKLIWDQREDIKSSVISIDCPIEKQIDHSNLDEYERWGLETMILFVDALRPRILKLDQ